MCLKYFKESEQVLHTKSFFDYKYWIVKNDQFPGK